MTYGFAAVGGIESPNDLSGNKLLWWLWSLLELFIGARQYCFRSSKEYAIRFVFVNIRVFCCVVVDRDDDDDGRAVGAV